MISEAEQAELDALELLDAEVEGVGDYIARLTPKYAATPAHLQPVIDVLDAAMGDEIFATISMPPRGGKTETLAHGLAHRIEYAPGALSFYATFGDGLSKQTSRRIRKLARAAGVPMDPKVQSVQDWRTAFEGGLKATSTGGDITGRGSRGGLMVADDLIKGRKAAESKLVRDTAWDWLRDDFLSRHEPGASVIVNMTRWHEDDIIGRLLRDPLGYPWIHIDIAAVIGPDGQAIDERTGKGARSFWPEVYDLVRLARIRMRGEYGWWSLYQQKPAPRGGGMFKRVNFQIIDAPPIGGRWVRRWDLAASTESSAAFTAGPLVGLVDGAIFVRDVKRGQWGPHKRDSEIVRTARTDGRGVEVWLPQDPGQAGLSQRPHYGKLLNGYTVRFERESTKKEIRWDPYASQVEARNVYLIKGDWNEEFIAEHEKAPTGRVKDQIDAMAGAYYALILIPPPTQEHGGEVGNATTTSAPTVTPRTDSTPLDYSY